MRIINYYVCYGLFWIRIFGYGIHIKDIRLHPPLFSERMGIRKKIAIGDHYRLGFLKRRDACWL